MKIFILGKKIQDSYLNKLMSVVSYWLKKTTKSLKQKQALVKIKIERFKYPFEYGISIQ